MIWRLRYYLFIFVVVCGIFGVYFFERNRFTPNYRVLDKKVLEIVEAANFPHQSFEVKVLEKPGGGNVFPEGSVDPLFTIEIQEPHEGSLSLLIYVDAQKFEEFSKSDHDLSDLNLSIKTRIINLLSGESVRANGGTVGDNFCLSKPCGERDFRVLERL